MKRLTIIILLAAAAGMVSCSAVRHCKAPDVDLPERIAGEDSDSLTVADVQWWRFYGDSTLCQIIERTLDNNRDMLAAAARVERLRELYRVSRAERLPSVTGTAYGDYETNDYAGEKSSRDPGFGAKAGFVGQPALGQTQRGRRIPRFGRGPAGDAHDAGGVRRRGLLQPHRAG